MTARTAPEPAAREGARPALLVASDLSVRSDRAVARGMRLAAALKARVVLAHVVDDALPAELTGLIAREAEAMLARIAATAAAGASEPPELRVQAGDVVPTLLALAEEISATAIVAGLHRRRPFLDDLLETTISRLVRLSGRPTVLVRDPADGDWRRILVAVDASPAAAVAARAAARLVPGAELVGFHAVHLPFSGLTGDGAGGAAARNAIAETRDVLRGWGRQHGLEALVEATVIEIGGLGEVMTRAIARSRPDCLALGTHARGALAPRLLGSFARSVMRAPPCDLLLTGPDQR